MGSSLYRINKGINKSIEFRGLKAQYISYFGGMVVLLLILFSAVYITGMNVYICIVIVATGGTFGTLKIFKLSHQYGEHGMMKAIAKRQVPKMVRSYTRKFFSFGLHQSHPF